MTVIEESDFTCHVCGNRFKSNVVLSTNNFFGPPVQLPPPRCPQCDTEPHYRIEYSPGTFYSVLFELAENTEIPKTAIERVIRWSTSESDIDEWLEGYRSENWNRLIRDPMGNFRHELNEKMSELRSDQPYGIFVMLQQDAREVIEPNEATRRFAAIQLPEFESWPQMDQAIRAMMYADPQIEKDAEEVIVRKWGHLASRFQHLKEELQKDLPSRIEAFFVAAKKEFSERVKKARERLLV